MTVGATTARQAVERFVEAVGELDDPAIFISITDVDALRSAADTIDARPPGDVPLRGLLFAVKDNIDVAGLPTTAGCPAFAYEPDASATVVERLVHAGAIAVGKTNLDQFATGLVGTRSPYGTPRNPIDVDHVPGGSSSGSAVAVARRLVDFALGTDTAGSGRVPASFCEVIGVKPTFGRLSTHGSVPAVRSADCISLFGTDLAELGRVLALASGFDSSDPYSRHLEPRSVLSPTDQRLGVVDEATLVALGTERPIIDVYLDTCERLAAGSASVRTVDLAPFLEAGSMLYGGPWVAERTAAVGEFVAAHGDDVDPVVAAIINGGHRFDAVDAHRARYRLCEIRRTVDAVFDTIDTLALPTVGRRATLAQVAADPVGVNTELGHFTTFANLLDLSALSIPPNLTLYGAAWADESLLRLAESLTGSGSAGDGCGHVDHDLGATVRLVVAGAHLRGQPLEHQLTDLGARFDGTTTTASSYRLFALAGSVPPKPGLVFDLSGRAIEVDIWRLSPDALGRFLQLVPAPLALGTVELADGSHATGFVCEPRALDAATEVTDFGGWRAFRASVS